MDALCSHRSSGRTSAQTRDPVFAQDLDKNGLVELALLTTYESAEQKPVLSFPSSSWPSFQPRPAILLSITFFGVFQQAGPFVETHCSAFLEPQRITSTSTQLHAAHLTKQLREAAVE